MSKIILFVRVSTEFQKIDDQKEELTKFAKARGYSKKDIIYVEAEGASAIKVDEKYQQKLNETKQRILEDKDINAIAVWELSRLARNTTIFSGYKDFCIAHHIQLYCMTPELQLLNVDGTLNGGMEVAMMMFATLSAQEMRVKKERMLRGRRANAQNGKWNGSKFILAGYDVNDDGYYIPHPTDAPIVRMIFEMYATGKYSMYGLWKELHSRGYKIRGKELNINSISAMLRCPAYVGQPTTRYRNGKPQQYNVNYPRIISDELWAECKKIREGNKTNLVRGENDNLCSRIMRCPVCGGSMVNLAHSYQCWHRAKRFVGEENICSCDIYIRPELADTAVWYVARELHSFYLNRQESEDKENAKNELTIIRQKISTMDEEIAKANGKRGRIIDNYADGLYTKKERDKKLQTLDTSISQMKKEIISMKEKETSLQSILEENNPDAKYMYMVDNLYNLPIEKKREIVHKYITKITPARYTDDTTKHGILLTIDTIVNHPYKIVIKSFQKEKLWLVNRIGKLKPLSSPIADVLEKHKPIPEKDRELYSE